ncbi:hypothetical protein M569_15084, partial [Genlisea aurea]
ELKRRGRKTRIEKDNKRKVLNAEQLVKKRTRSEREPDEMWFLDNIGNGNNPSHIPVLLGEVMDVFASVRLKSFVDCTLGAGGHSSAMIRAHPEMELYVGLDVDPVAHQIAQPQLDALCSKDSDQNRAGELQAHILLKNFKNIKSVLRDIGGNQAASGVYGIFMDLGVSSMQVDTIERGFSVLKDGPLDMRMNPLASLRADDIINSWPAEEIGRILREYGEEANWFSLQNKIIKARSSGGLHSTGELVRLIRSSASSLRGGRHGWIKTATRVFQAVRIAVNDELTTLKESLLSSFCCLAPGGRLAVISFHSLEDRIVKQTFLDIATSHGKDDDEMKTLFEVGGVKEAWMKQVINGHNARILTKRPITPSEMEEKMNPRSRSAKLRVIEKI